MVLALTVKGRFAFSTIYAVCDDVLQNKFRDGIAPQQFWEWLEEVWCRSFGVGGKVIIAFREGLGSDGCTVLEDGLFGQRESSINPYVVQ